MNVEPCDATLGAHITGVRLAELDSASWHAIEAAFAEHAVLIFPGQALEPHEQVAFGRRFGQIEHLYGDKGFVFVSNQRPDGSLLEDDNPAMQVMRGTEGWHTDSSYMPCAAKASILSARVVPKAGGETEWADMRDAYRTLDPERRARIEPLSAFHSIRYSQARIGHELVAGALAGYGADVTETPRRPLVKIHPVTGEPALYIGRHAYGIPGLAEAESEALLDELLAFACRPPRVLHHRWQPGDVAIWDNRCVLHRARPYDHNEPRVMVHVRVAGDPATESALPTSQAS
jgi:alpha-ketoglutarate-dependent taurine dioxygenase